MTTVVETRTGAVQGYHTGRCLFFGGIPYAGSTAGRARFRPPVPPEPWIGVRPAVYPGPIVPQNQTRFDPFLGPEPQPQSEDSLSVNVWTPAADGAGRPVHVWIHGGAYVSGSGSFPLYDGSAFAARGDIVCVTINYRLGERGYLHLAHLDPTCATSGNTALLDQVAALEWVRDNIAAFGGDPGQVTVGGQSAGAGSITGLMMMPAARGLFHRAIIQSISFMSFRDRALAEAATATFMEAAGASTVADLEAAPITTLLAAQRTVMRSRPPWKPVGLQPMVDGTVLGKDVLPAAADGDMAPVPILIGTTTDEWKPFNFFMDPAALPRDEAAAIRLLDEVTGDGAGHFARYRAALGDRPAPDLFDAVMGDWRWWAPTMRFADLLAGRQPVHLYEFAWTSPTHGGALGAGHCVELPFCFHNLATPSTPFLIGDAPPVALADAMHGAWCSFIRDGVPVIDGADVDWPRYDLDRRATMIFDAESRCADDPRGALGATWREQE